MKKLVLAVLSFMFVAAITVSAMAGEEKAKSGDTEKKGSKFPEMFKKADVNADGKLSLEEYKAVFTRGEPEKKFTAADADKDGFVTMEEMKAAHDKHAKEGKSEKPAAKEEAAK